VLCKECNDADKKYNVPLLYQLLKKKMDPKKYSMSLGRIIEKVTAVFLSNLMPRYF
jgi:hypothetical protein